MSRNRKIALGLVGALVLLVAVLLLRASTEREPIEPAEALALEVDRDRMAETLAAYVRIDTSSVEGIPRSPRPAFLDLLIERYVTPLGLEHEVLEDRVLLVRWRAGTEAGPIVYMSHSDVVPVSEDELDDWTHPPFEGVIADGYVWGRGTIDDKGATVAQLEAIAALMEAGLTPRHDVFLLISPDEEIVADDGAALVVERHRARLEDPWAVIDEGSFVAPDYVPDTRLIPIGVGEKRFVTFTLSARGEPGHASMPRPDAAPLRLARAMGRLAELEMPIEVPAATDVFLERIADRMGFVDRLALKNRWLLDPIVLDLLTSRPASNAMVRDTLALTILDGGVKDNVVPARVTATYNMRLLPGSDLDAAFARIREAIADDTLTIEVLDDGGPSPVAPIEGERWERLTSAIRAAFPGDDVIIAPMITPGTMDARHFASAGFPTYRFIPFTLDAEERGGMHGTDERVSIDNLEQAARGYAHLMRHW